MKTPRIYTLLALLLMVGVLQAQTADGLKSAPTTTGFIILSDTALTLCIGHPSMAFIAALIVARHGNASDCKTDTSTYCIYPRTASYMLVQTTFPQFIDGMEVPGMCCHTSRLLFQSHLSRLLMELCI